MPTRAVDPLGLKCTPHLIAGHGGEPSRPAGYFEIVDESSIEDPSYWLGGFWSGGHYAVDVDTFASAKFSDDSLILESFAGGRVIHIWERSDKPAFSSATFKISCTDNCAAAVTKVEHSRPSDTGTYVATYNGSILYNGRVVTIDFSSESYFDWSSDLTLRFQIGAGGFGASVQFPVGGGVELSSRAAGAVSWECRRCN